MPVGKLGKRRGSGAVRLADATFRQLSGLAGKHGHGLVQTRSTADVTDAAKFWECAGFDRDDSLSFEAAFAGERSGLLVQRDSVTGKLRRVDTLLLRGRPDKSVKVSRESSKSEQRERSAVTVTTGVDVDGRTTADVTLPADTLRIGRKRYSVPGNLRRSAPRRTFEVDCAPDVPDYRDAE